MPLLRLAPEVQHYDWGDVEFIPQLTGRPNLDGRPHAELWMGAHPDLPARVNGESLLALLEREGDSLLGPDVARSFDGQLPYLIKVLAARGPLSIQAHPTAAQARRGFEREEAEGIPRDARNRCYRDRGAKPELLVALTDFRALAGFRPLEEIAATVEEVPELRRLAPGLEPSPAALEALYTKIMKTPQEEIDALVAPLLERVRRHRYDPSRREHWLLRCDDAFSSEGRHDRGLLSILLLNLVELRPGQALFLDAGELHAYLEGAGLEIMACSNNVLRGGLTRKHVSVDELLAVLRFEGGLPRVLEPEGVSETESIYRTPAEAFELARLEVRSDHPHASASERYGPEILFSTEAPGELWVVSGAERLRLRRGESLLVPHGVAYRIEGEGTVFRAGVPDRRPRFRGRRPTELRFGTSGLRGLVEDITDLEAYVDTRGFLAFLQDGRLAYRGDPVAVAGDLRPSTERILASVARAAEASGMRVEHLGRLPTPALTYYGLTKRRASIMVTGSHIPFDRNGIKFVKPAGEVLKEDEADILAAVAQARRREYARARDASLFADDGSFRSGVSRELPAPIGEGKELYVERYLDFFPEGALRGHRVLVFQHSAVGRDLLQEILTRLGAEAVPVERSETFLPIDTEDVRGERLDALQAMVARAGEPAPTALVSTDGDSDRPLVCGVSLEGRVRFVGGDLLGILVAGYLGADAVVVPVSANDAVDRWCRERELRCIKTRIGSPYVVRGMEELARNGRYARIVGFEANGGFLTGSDIERDGRKLRALPTRDAALPILAALHLARLEDASLSELLSRLPPRFGSAGLLDAFPREASRAIVERFSSPEGQREIGRFFEPSAGFGTLQSVDDLDGLRLFFDNGDIAHVRASGNAPQLRIYAVADSQERADEIVRLALREPDGILRRLAEAVGSER